jgi:carbon-monoxide dehydrogenase medium subunit
MQDTESTTARFVAPASVAEVVDLLKSANGQARVLAGGTDLLAQMKAGLRKPELIVDLKRIPELMAIQMSADGLRLGAAAAAAEISEHRELCVAYPGLAEAVALIGSTQIQGRASVGGNLCNGSPAADTVPSLVVLGAVCVIAGPSGRRELGVADFVTGPGETALGAGELLAELRIPAPPARSADAYLRFIPRTEMDIAVAGAAVAVELAADGSCAAARVALGAVAPTVVAAPQAAAALVGSRFDADALARAAAAASEACNPIDDKRGTIAYRRKVAGVLVRRAAAIAADRARERTA